MKMDDVREMDIKVDGHELTESVCAEVARASEQDLAHKGEENLSEALSELKSWGAELKEREGRIEDREHGLQVRETKAMTTEAALSEREKRIERRIEELSQRERLLAEQEARSADFPVREQQLLRKERELEAREEGLDARQKELDDLHSESIRRAQEVQAALAKAQSDEAGKLHVQLAALRQERIEALAKELDGMRTSVEQEIAGQRRNWEEESKGVREALEQAQEEQRKAQAEMESEQKTLEFERACIKKREDDIKILHANIEEEASQKVSDYRQQIREEAEIVRAENKRLHEELKTLHETIAGRETFEAVYGGSKEVIEKKMRELQEANEALRRELGERPGPELQAECIRVKKERDTLRNELDEHNDKFAEMQAQVLELDDLRNKNTLLAEQNESLNARWTEAQGIVRNYEEQVKRLTAAEMTPADWDKRAASLREPYLEHPFRAPKEGEPELGGRRVENEIDWLNEIERACTDYGLHFPQRVLYAFHTSFKIANWSALTVLAGVSGTGKSELPRLYAAFGGFNFINVPVQPNWDSQESMLGFFNSIDNKFDAQPLLRFLVECTESYDDNMAIVLLDEMNLAHVEHYFADFLSKLETRRSAPADNLPKIHVNLGAGVKPYDLPLKRNLLWCGTMNQDETTKSLSDKVLDRGIVINFPRPRRLIDREGARNLDRFREQIGLSRMNEKRWNSWREKKINMQGKQREKLDEYRSMLEKMNDYLSHAGRAIGHRVWQAIEHYVMNYPTVRAALRPAGSEAPITELTPELAAAMHIAVEDQIVQKVMPKLRGIDTRGKSMKRCLQPIKTLLIDRKFNLEADFDRACEMGYGQFMWGSAEYIEEDEEKRLVREKTDENS